MTQTIRVAGICGSIRKGSFARMALRTALEGAGESGANTKLIDLSEYQLVFCDGKENESAYPRDVFRLREEYIDRLTNSYGRPTHYGQQPAHNGNPTSALRTRKANGRNRTADLRITSALLCRLSYVGVQTSFTRNSLIAQ